MGVFSYTALDATGAFVRGSIDAKNTKKANARLTTEGFLVVNLKKDKKIRFAKVNQGLARITRLDKIFFTRHLYTLLESGIALDQSLHIISQQTENPKFKKLLETIHLEIQSGQSLYGSLERHPKYFPKFFTSLVEIGERSGKLDEVLLHILEQQEKDHELVTKVRGAMIYPTIIVVAALSMVSFMVVFVIPKIVGILSEYNVDLPLATKVLIGISYFISHYGLIAFPLSAVIVYMVSHIWRSTERGRMQIDALKLRIPLVKKIVIEFNLARLSRALAALLKSGVSLDKALELSMSVVGNRHYRKSIEAATAFVRKGISLTEVFNGYPRLYPPIASRMIDVGERTGQLDRMLDRLALFYEKSVSRTLSNLSTIIEPLLLLVIGAVVGLIALSILTPVWKFSETI